ncbi:MAG: oxidoreductase [Flavobacteriaceae bacterium]|nr:oxidoreductase [Flavobacteriaceae bacterium]
MRWWTILLILFSLTSCLNTAPKSISKVEIDPIYTDSLSIRAIAAVDDSNVWFAANKGRIGLIHDTVPKLATISYEERALEFRAIGLTSEALFVLSIGSPAVLYKIGYQNEQATNIEEVYIEEGKNVFYDAIRFWNDEEGIAMGDPTDGCLSILITRDGGDTWNKLSCDQLPTTAPGEAAFAASNSNIAIVGDNAWLVTGGTRARVFHSSDKGKTWEVYSTPIIQGQAMTGIYSVDFYDEQKGIIIGGNWDQQDSKNGNKAITTDGGQTWNLIADGQEPGYRSSVRYVPGSNGKGIVAVGMPGISYSNDGGAQWIELSKEGFYAIEFVNDSIAFASGKNKIARLKFE